MSISLEYVKKNARKYKLTSNSVLYKKDNQLYKVFKKIDFKDTTSKQIEYNHMLRNEVSPTIVLPTDIIRETDKYYDYTVVGYEQPYITSYTFQSSLKKNIPIEKKQLIVNSLFKSLEEINHFLVVGDINLENLLFPKDKTDNNGYMIDLDFAKRLNSNIIMRSNYNIRGQHNLIANYDTNTDIIKMFISTLSFLYKYNFEELVLEPQFPTLDIILDMLQKLENNGILISYCKYIKDYYDKNLIIDQYLEIPASYSIEKEINHGIDRLRKLK